MDFILDNVNYSTSAVDYALCVYIYHLILLRDYHGFCIMSCTIIYIFVFFTIFFSRMTSDFHNHHHSSQPPTSLKQHKYACKLCALCFGRLNVLFGPPKLNSCPTKQIIHALYVPVRLGFFLESIYIYIYPLQ